MSFATTTLVRLHSVPGLGSRSLAQILAWTNGANEQLETLFQLNSTALQGMFGLKPQVADTITQSSAALAYEITAALQEGGFRVLTRFDADYPALLLERLPDAAPPILYVRGNLTLLSQPAIAFSGSRHVSERGIAHTAALTRQAVKRVDVVTSGHAPGVDAAAHLNALSNGGMTALILPEGVLKFKLRAELRPYEQDASRWVIVSEFPPRLPWSVQNAMTRNQTIVGLSRALCVIEAGETGGTLDAGRRALKLGIPLFVLRYGEWPQGSEGNQVLLNEGATAIETEPHLRLPDISNTTSKPESPPLPKQMSLFDDL